MASRAEDWLRQARRGLDHARAALERETFEWAAFAAQQAAEKAVKAVFQSLGGDARGHSVTELLLALPSQASPGAGLIEAAKELDKHYIGPRYPTRTPRGHRWTSTRVARRNGPSAARSGSLSTVKVTYFDRGTVERALDEYVRSLVARRPDVEEIILFGSLVTGIPVPGSDVDLLFILSSSDRRFLDRIPEFLPAGFPVGVDVFPYTREEIERMTAESNRFVQGVLREGRTLFRR